ncbi:glycosyltransferase [Desulfonatronum lacustre]|uniref:glycosyltransferase family protein n=1 Tax=Desulfonatronum lacustre TaxID=66849 RepID=UPI0004BA68F5|nr:glycosyltransferase [Desulfonatronum lacustre]
MRLCVINCALQNELQSLGNTVLGLHPKPGIHDLPRLLEEHRFEPDVVIQQESLGPRVLLKGLENISGLKVFWSIDTHLNAFWQMEYVRLFDLACSTQRNWSEYLHKQTNVPAFWLPWFGRRLPWKGWNQRQRAVCFVGRVTEHRPSRKRFVDFLRREFQMELVQDVSFQQMLEVYREARLAPNESIFGEINFRLFEAASCGCLVLNPSGIPGLEETFLPDREIGVFSHALELKSKVNHYSRNQGLAEQMAKAAWARIQEEHLAIHRAQKLLEAVTQATGRSSSRPEPPALSWALTLYRLWQARRVPIATEVLENQLLALPESPRKREALLGFWLGTNRRDLVLHDLMTLLQPDIAYGNEPSLARNASLAALHLGEFTLATAFWMRYRKSTGRMAKKPLTPHRLYLEWSREMMRDDYRVRRGFVYDHERQIPESALECLIMGHRLNPHDMDICKAMDALLQKEPGFEPTRLALLSHVTLHQPLNWQAGLKLGLVNLQDFRLEQGLEELLLAASRAEEQGESRKFNNALAAADPDGSIRATLNL